MPETGKERRWPERVLLAANEESPFVCWFDAEEGYAGFPRAEEIVESEAYVPKAALAKARKEGREEVRGALLTNAGALDQAADQLEQIAGGEGPDRIAFNGWEHDRILEQRSALRSLAEETRALDSLTKEGE